MKYHTIGFSLLHNLSVNLIAVKGDFSLFCFALLTHRCPYIGIDNISVSSTAYGIVDNSELIAVGFAEIDNLLSGVVILRTNEGNVHSNLKAADSKGMSHIITVADKAEVKSFELTFILSDCH